MEYLAPTFQNLFQSKMILLYLCMIYFFTVHCSIKVTTASPRSSFILCTLSNASFHWQLPSYNCYFYGASRVVLFRSCPVVLVFPCPHSGFVPILLTRILFLLGLVLLPRGVRYASPSAILPITVLFSAPCSTSYLYLFYFWSSIFRVFKSGVKVMKDFSKY